jgi:hypothetical protein
MSTVGPRAALHRLSVRSGTCQLALLMGTPTTKFVYGRPRMLLFAALALAAAARAEPDQDVVNPKDQVGSNFNLICRACILDSCNRPRL